MIPLHQSTWHEFRHADVGRCPVEYDDEPVAVATNQEQEYLQV
jgi:hypothetical protein